MALIKCPECGKENVSDSAEACPDCGYGIKAHFDKIKSAEEERIRKQKQEEEKKRAILAEQNRREERIKNVPKPVKPVFSRGMRNYLIIATIWWIFCITNIANAEWNLRLSGFMEIVFLTEIIPLLIYIFVIHIPEWSKYKFAQKDFGAYQRLVILKQDERIARQNAYVEAEIIRQMNAPKCPSCGSTQIEKITTMDRAISISMVGVASGKIGKQYKCRNCKHMW